MDIFSLRCSDYRIFESVNSTLGPRVCVFRYDLGERIVQLFRMHDVVTFGSHFLLDH